MLKRYYRFKEAVGLHIHLNGNEMSINFCHLVIDGHQLNIANKGSNIRDLKELTKHLKQTIPASITITGRGMLLKKLPLISDFSLANASGLLPGVDLNDFYFQHFPSGDFSFVSLIRKADVAKWVEKLSAMIHPLMISLGPFAVNNILEQLNHFGTQLSFNGFLITFNEDKQWTEVRVGDENKALFPLKIESEKIDENLFLSYAAAFQLLFHDTVEVIETDIPNVINRRVSWVANQQLKVKAFLIGTLCFVLLLINFIFFSYLSKENGKLADRIDYSSRNTSNFVEKQGTYFKGIALLDTLGWEGGLKKSALLDDLGTILPHGINWTKVQVDPIDQKQLKEHRIKVYLSRTIVINGTADGILNVNEWVALIRIKKWVKKAELTGYTFDTENNLGQFSVVIKY